MLREIGVAERVLFLLSSMLPEKIERVLSTDDLELKLCTYADQKVAPKCIVSVSERFDDLRKRYSHRATHSFGVDRERFVNMLERQLFDSLSISREDIDENAISPYIRSYSLRNSIAR